MRGVVDHRCRHVELQPGLVAQADGELLVGVDDGLEARLLDLEHKEPVSALLAGDVSDLLVEDHGNLCRWAERVNDIIR